VRVSAARGPDGTVRAGARLWSKYPQWTFPGVAGRRQAIWSAPVTTASEPLWSIPHDMVESV